MSQIIIVKGKPYSFNNTEIVLNGGEQYLFEIKDLYDEKDHNTLTWKIYKANGGILKEKTGKCNEEFTCNIDKKLCGDYRYELEAIVKQPDATILSTQRISLGGYCTPKILSYKTNIPEEIKPEQGINAYFEIEAEGLNGNYLTLDLWFSDPNYIGYSTSEQCIEGKAKAKILYLWSKLPKSNLPKFDLFKFTKGHSFPFLHTKSPSSSCSSSKLEAKDFRVILSIKLKDASGKYVKESDNKDFILSMNVTSEFKAPNKIPLPPMPSNKTIATVNQSEEINMEVNGIIELISLKIDNTPYQVCNDINSDAKDIWILSDSTTGASYHWMKKREKIDRDKKPQTLPIAFKSDLKPDIHARIDCLFDVNNLKVRLVDPLNNFQFDVQEIKSMKKEDPISTLIFSSKISLDKIAYYKNYKFELDYSLDNAVTWMPLQKILFEFYIIHNASKYHSPNIPETLLYIGCKENHNESNTISEKDLLMNIFNDFSHDKKVFRRRELDIDNKRSDGSFYISPTFITDGIGYWRGISSLKGAFAGVKRTGTLHDLLNYGEARCGEWMRFLIGITEVQGLAHALESVAICTDIDRRAATGYSFQSSANRLGDKIKGKTFAVKNARLSDVDNPTTTTGTSAGIGNLTAQPYFQDHVWCYHPNENLFLDPSYGSSCEKKLSTYCSNNLSSIFLKKISVPITADHCETGEPTRYKIITTNNSILNTDIHEYIWSDRDVF